MRSCFLLIIAAISGCTSFGTAHQNFIKSMEITIRDEVTIDRLSDSNYDPIFAKKEELTEIEEMTDGSMKYHYAHPNLWKKHCHYYLIIEKQSKKVIGWGFDYEKSDPKKNCGISG